MQNNIQKLHTKLFTKDVERRPVRDGFGEGLVEVAEQDERVVGLCADLTESTRMHLFAQKFPERFFNVGVAEQNLVSVASGMAHMNKIPFVASYATFSPGRNWEQIRTTICYNDVPVKIIGSHVGVTVGPDGGTHQALEDIALMNTLPNMTVISPCDAIEAKKATVAMKDTDGPVYMRLSRHSTPLITTEKTPFSIGTGQIVYDSQSDVDDTNKVGIIATGALLYQALLATQILSQKGIGVQVLHLATIKPLDEKMILALARNMGAIVTVEEHQINGGLGSIIAQALSQTIPTPIEYVGVKDRFGQSGTPSELVKEYELDEGAIVRAVQKVLQRKRR